MDPDFRRDDTDGGRPDQNHQKLSSRRKPGSTLLPPPHTVSARRWSFLRSLGSRTRLRRRMEAGVTSTSSSSAM